MQPTKRKTQFLGLIIATLAATTAGALAACSTNAQNETQAPSPTVTSASNPNPTVTPGTMNHGNMEHGAGHHMEMDLGPADAEYDLRFIDAMIPHHEGALTMAQDVLQKSKRPELRKLAQDIIKAQEKEINQMKRWRTAWYPKAPTQPVAWHAQMGHSMTMFPEQIKSLRMEMDLGLADTEFDLRFINAMIPHHEGAVVMAQDVIGKSQRPELQKLAQDIITSQEAEIAQMKQWRKTWYGK